MLFDIVCQNEYWEFDDVVADVKMRYDEGKESKLRERRWFKSRWRTEGGATKCGVGGTEDGDREGRQGGGTVEGSRMEIQYFGTFMGTQCRLWMGGVE